MSVYDRIIADIEADILEKIEHLAYFQRAKRDSIVKDTGGD